MRHQFFGCDATLNEPRISMPLGMGSVNVAFFCEDESGSKEDKRLLQINNVIVFFNLSRRKNQWEY